MKSRPWGHAGMMRNWAKNFILHPGFLRIKRIFSFPKKVFHFFIGLAFCQNLKLFYKIKNLLNKFLWTHLKNRLYFRDYFRLFKIIFIFSLKPKFPNTNYLSNFTLSYDSLMPHLTLPQLQVIGLPCSLMPPSLRASRCPLSHILETYVAHIPTSQSLTPPPLPSLSVFFSLKLHP